MCIFTTTHKGKNAYYPEFLSSAYLPLQQIFVDCLLGARHYTVIALEKYPVQQGDGHKQLRFNMLFAVTKGPQTKGHWQRFHREDIWAGFWAGRTVSRRKDQGKTNKKKNQVHSYTESERALFLNTKRQDTLNTGWGGKREENDPEKPVLEGS